MVTRAQLLALTLGGATLLGAGVWLGRSSSASAQRPALVATAGRQPGAPIPLGARPAATAPELVAAAATPTPMLARARTAPPLPGLARDLRDPDPKIRRAAMHEAAHDPDTAIDVLLAASRDADLEVGFTAMGALADRYARGELPADELIARATDPALNERVRLLALNAVGATPSAAAAATLQQLLHTGDPTERRAAAILLARQEPALAMPALIDALGDADEYVRANALEALRSRARGRDFATDAAAWRAWWQSQQS